MMRRFAWRSISAFTLIILVSGWFSASANPLSHGRIPALPLNQKTDWTIADFDGDRNPDLAHLIARNAGTIYQIDIGLSSTGQTGSFIFPNPNGWEIDLAAIDVDGDRDLDLVVSERFRKQRIGVFLNDGRGSFSKASSDLSSEAFRKTTWTSAVPNDSFQALDTKPPRRLDGDLERCGVISPQRVAFSAAAGVLLISIFDPGRGPHAIRAPPAICDVHSFTQND